MTRLKLLGLVCFGALALGSLMSAAAYAGGEWDVNGTKLVGTAALNSSALVLSVGKLHTELFNIICKGHEISINKGQLVAPDGLSASDLTFHECKMEGAAGCELGSPLILTVPIHGLAHLDNGERLNTLILVLPQTKTIFATIAIVGELCSLKTTNDPITGGVHLLVDEGYLPAESHLVLAITLKGQLKVGSVEGSFEEVDADLKLASGLSWNFL